MCNHNFINCIGGAPGSQLGPDPSFLCFSSVPLIKYRQNTFVREAPLPTLFHFVIQLLYNSAIAITDITQPDRMAALSYKSQINNK